MSHSQPRGSRGVERRRSRSSSAGSRPDPRDCSCQCSGTTERALHLAAARVASVPPAQQAWPHPINTLWSAPRSSDRGRVQIMALGPIDSARSCPRVSWLPPTGEKPSRTRTEHSPASVHSLLSWSAARISSRSAQKHRVGHSPELIQQESAPLDGGLPVATARPALIGYADYRGRPNRYMTCIRRA